MGLTDKLTEFVIKYSNHTKKGTIREIIRKHLEYNTCIYLTDEKNEIGAVVRWNISKSGIIAHVLDLIVRPDFRRRGLIKTMLIKGLIKYPLVRFLSWERETKYPDRERRVYSVEKILKGVKVNV